MCYNNCTNSAVGSNQALRGSPIHVQVVGEALIPFVTLSNLVKNSAPKTEKPVHDDLKAWSAVVDSKLNICTFRYLKGLIWTLNQS